MRGTIEATLLKSDKLELYTLRGHT